MSIAPFLPCLSFLITSGDIYIGVPVRELFIARPASAVLVEGLANVGVGILVRCIVLVFFAMTLAAPKSTNFNTPL